MAFDKVLVVLVAGLLAITPAAAAVCGNSVVEAGEDCDDGSSQNGGMNSCCTAACTFSGKTPDVIVGDLISTQSYGTVTGSGIYAYAVGTTSCNVGSCWLNWIAGTAEHPVIGQNLYRLKNGRFEQIGQSWLKHGYTATTGSLCATCNPPPNGAHLGVACSDTYIASLNGTQTHLGPKVDVNPDTGVFLFPDTRLNLTGDAIFKRLQAHTADVDPAQNNGALYFVESQYVTHDDAAAQHNANNASYRPATIATGATFPMTLTGTTQRGKMGVQAWKATDASVTETMIPAPEGLFVLSAKATSLGGGVYHYEYALENLTNQRAAQSFSVPLPPGTVVTNVGFHDVDYHSGEPFDGTNWTGTVSASAVTWQTTPYATNQNANALRWGTLYNFRFDANVAPSSAGIGIALFKPGFPASVTATSVVPNPCVAAANGTPCSDGNDCTANDHCQSHACVGEGIVVPGEVDNGVRVSQLGGVTTITWNQAPGSTWSDVLRGLVGGLPVGPGGGDETCLVTGTASTSATDPVTPNPGDAFWYLVQGGNACGNGPYGSALLGGVPTPRASATCP
jgi:hypothetical protein